MIICCQSVWAQTTEHSNPLALYVPLQDELCNYCQDYTVGAVPAGHLATLYQPGLGYPNPVGGEQRADRNFALSASAKTSSQPQVPNK